MSFSPKEISAEIKKHIPGFKIPTNPITASRSPTAGPKVLMTVWLQGIGDGNPNLILPR
jgi:hypothetical protein